MNITELWHNPLLLCPLISWLVAQVLKTIIHSIDEHRFDITRFLGDGGMPSGHSATVSSLATVCALKYGFGSELFAISTILAIVVMHDAMGVRRESGKQARVLNEIVEYFNSYSMMSNVDKLKELLGHTPLQVFFGAVLGVVVTLIVGVQF